MPSPLEQFAKDRSEDAFRKLVDDYGGLVFASALRRTGDAPLAEEVTQNVFTILAAKANRLTRHPSLSGWLFTTTKLESSKAMRAKKRHARKMEALAGESSHATRDGSDAESENWRDAIPHLDESLDRLPTPERDLLLARFFEEQSFKEIASESGKSEAACKMRVKRTLEKLNRWLGAKGITLSITSLGVALSAELTKAAPAAITTGLPAKVIAAGSATGGTAFLTNIWNAMNTMKTTAAAAAAVIAIGSVPIIVQQSDANDLKQQLNSLEEQAAALRSGGATNDENSPRKTGARSTFDLNSAAGTSTPIKRLLAMSKPPGSGEELLETLYSAMLDQDMVALIRAFVPLAQIDNAELKKLISEVEASTKNEPVKPMTLQMLTALTPEAEQDPGGMLDRHIAKGVHGLNLVSNMSRWAKQDPEAALAWFRKSRESGAIYGTGIHNSPEAHLAGALAAALAASNPEQAIALVNEVDPTSRNTVIENVASTFAAQDAAGQARARDLLQGVSDPEGRRQVLERTISSMTVSRDLEHVLGFVDTLELDPVERTRALATAAASNRADLSVTERMDWILENTPENAHVEAIAAAVSRLHWSHGTGTSDWIDNISPGDQRDAALGAEARALLSGNNREQALERSLLIQNEARRLESAQGVLRFWERTNPESARAAARAAGVPMPTSPAQR